MINECSRCVQFKVRALVSTCVYSCTVNLCFKRLTEGLHQLPKCGSSFLWCPSALPGLSVSGRRRRLLQDILANHGCCTGIIIVPVRGNLAMGVFFVLVRFVFLRVIFQCVDFAPRTAFRVTSVATKYSKNKKEAAFVGRYCFRVVISGLSMLFAP